MLRPRTGDILKFLVNEYIGTATPVASEELARRFPLKVSSATIRNEMAELEEEGYITRPHVSAGGVPSDKGYRFYVESLEDPLELPPSLQRQIRTEFSQAGRDVDSWIRLAASLLSRTAHNMAVVTLPRSPAARLKYLQLVYLQEALALLIIVVEQASLRHRLLPLDEPATQSELSEVANRINESIVGMSYREIRSKQWELSPLEEMVVADTSSILKGVDDETELAHYMDGLRLLLGQPELAHSRLARDLVEVLEEKAALRELLSGAPEKGMVRVFIGEENPEGALKSFSVILSQYGIPNEAAGTVCVIGPTRMEYASVIAGVRFLSDVMSDLVLDVQGKAG